MKMLHLNLILSLLTVFIFIQINYGQDEIIRIDTELVTVPATVTNRNGWNISELKREDFHIFENGVEQEINYFESVNQPFTIFFLLETSPTMERRMAELAYAANSFFAQLRPQDRIVVISFCEYTKILQKETSVADIKNKVKIKLKTCGKYSGLYEAVDFVLRKAKKVSGRKAILLFSDGKDAGITTSTLGFFVTGKDNLQDAEKLDSLIYTIQFKDSAKIEYPCLTSKQICEENAKIPDDYMRNLAKIGGGVNYQINDISNLQQTFGKVAKELGQQYIIGYYPNSIRKTGERRQLEVRVNLPNAIVRARESYLVDKTGPSKQKQ